MSIDIQELKRKLITSNIRVTVTSTNNLPPEKTANPAQAPEPVPEPVQPDIKYPSLIFDEAAQTEPLQRKARAECYYCGEKSLIWEEHPKGWTLFDKEGKRHFCQSFNKAMSRMKRLIADAQAVGVMDYIPRVLIIADPQLSRTPEVEDWIEKQQEIMWQAGVHATIVLSLGNDINKLTYDLLDLFLQMDACWNTVDTYFNPESLAEVRVFRRLGRPVFPPNGAAFSSWRRSVINLNEQNRNDSKKKK